MQYPFALMLSHYFAQLTGALSILPILALKKMRVIIPLCGSLCAYIYSAQALRKQQQKITLNFESIESTHE